MTDSEQAREMLRQYLKAREETPWVADWLLKAADRFEAEAYHGASHGFSPRWMLQRMGGLA